MKQLEVESQRDLSAKLNQLRHLAQLGFSAGLEKAYLVISRDSLQNRSGEQNKKFHALIGDIARTVKIDQRYSMDAWKALLVDAFEQELLSQGESLPKPSKMEVSFDGQRAVSVRPSTTSFNKKIAAKFIEFLYAFGVEHGAVFREESVQIFEQATVEVHQ